MNTSPTIYPNILQVPLIWWIDTFTVCPTRYYKYRIVGFNTGSGSDISWNVPALRGPYAFRLRQINAGY